MWGTTFIRRWYVDDTDGTTKMRLTHRRKNQHEARLERAWGGGSVQGAVVDVRHGHHDAGSFRTVRYVRAGLEWTD